MNNKKSSALTIILIIPFLPLIALLFVCMLVAAIFFFPTDFIKYRRSPYYKDFGKKYRIFLSQRAVADDYNIISRYSLPFTYVENESAQYFIKEGTVYLSGYSAGELEENGGEWYICFDTEHSESIPLSCEIEKASEKLNAEHRGLPVKLLWFSGKDSDSCEQAVNCPYFECYENGVMQK